MIYHEVIVQINDKAVLVALSSRMASFFLVHHFSLALPELPPVSQPMDPAPAPPSLAAEALLSLCMAGMATLIMMRSRTPRCSPTAVGPTCCPAAPPPPCLTPAAGTAALAAGAGRAGTKPEPDPDLEPLPEPVPDPEPPLVAQPPLPP